MKISFNARKTIWNRFGDSILSIATLNNDYTPEIIEKLNDSNSSLASAVYFPEEGDVVVGERAIEAALTNPANVAKFTKFYLGKITVVRFLETVIWFKRLLSKRFLVRA